MSIKLESEYEDYLIHGATLGEDYCHLVGITGNEYYRKFSSDASTYLAFALSTKELESDLSRFLSGKFNLNNTAHDKTIDEVYLKTHIGGSTLHHNYDGNHTFSGALDALRNKHPNDTEFQHIIHMTEHFARDLTTPSGINPFLNPEQFIEIKSILQETYHIKMSLVNDLLNQNAAEVFAVTLAGLGLLLEFNESQADKLGQFGSRFLTMGYMSGNPLMIMFATIALATGCFLVWNGESALKLVEGATRGAVSAGSFMLVSMMYAPPLFFGVALATLVSVASTYICTKVLSFGEETFDEIIKSQFPDYRSYVGAL